jgi:ribosome recycling factor
MEDTSYKEIEAKMTKAIQALKEELAGLRAGRANPAMLDKISVDYYGVPTPINQLGSISVPEARVIVIQPWEPKILKDVEKAIQKADIGINPNNDGKVIRLIFPVLTEERRRELTKTVKKQGEDTKIAVRAVRREAIEQFKAQEKKSEITEDDLRLAEQDVQKLTDKYVADIDKIVEDKEKEIMEV